ncbi:MAG: hypothetical protein JJ895_00170 [Balneolaceae bacterium]|nr:hypothetical protein [Balneolaceae bacterium]
MKVRILLTDHFYEELEKLIKFSTNEWGVKLTQEYLEDIDGALDLISLNPDVLTTRDSICPSFNTYLVNKHWLICHRFKETVIVLTIILTSRNVIENLTEFEPILIQEIKTLSEKLKQNS